MLYIYLNVFGRMQWISVFQVKTDIRLMKEELSLIDRNRVAGFVDPFFARILFFYKSERTKINKPKIFKR